MSQSALQEQINAINKKYGGGAKLASSPQAVEHAEERSIERLLQMRAQFAQEYSLVAAEELKKNGHVPAMLVFGIDENQNLSAARNSLKSSSEVAEDLSRLICS